MPDYIQEEMQQEDFDIVAYIVVHNFTDFMKFEKNLTKGEKVAKQYLLNRDHKTAKQTPIDCDTMGTKHTYKDFVIDVVLKNNESFDVVVSVDDTVICMREAPVEFGMTPCGYRSMEEKVFQKKINNHSKKTNALVNTMNYALIDQFIVNHAVNDAKIFKHAIEGIVFHSFGRKVPYFFEFSHDRLLWRYNLSDKKVSLQDSNSRVVIDFSHNNIQVDIKPRLHNHLGRLHYTADQAMACVVSFLDAVSAGFRFKSGYITFHKGEKGLPVEQSPAGSAIIKMK